MYEMKDEFYTGIELIDEEHKRLFEIASEAYYLLNDDFIVDKYDGCREIIEELIAYTKKHFADEEAYMESINYKRILSQKIQHQEFIDKLESVDLDKVDDNPEEAIQEILTFLTDWLIHHILNMDKKIAE